MFNYSRIWNRKLEIKKREIKIYSLFENEKTYTYIHTQLYYTQTYFLFPKEFKELQWIATCIC